MSLTWSPSSPQLVNTEVTGTFTFKTDDVRAVYVDWDDGTSNKKNEANYQWLTSTEPTNILTATHTYNKTGTFKPVVQSINSQGIVSRYYANESSNSDIVPFSQNTGMDNLVMNDNTPTAISRLDKVLINSGIDNSIMDVEGPRQLYIAIAPTLTRTELTGTIQEIQVSVEGVVARNKLNASTGAGQEGLAVGTDISQETITSTIDFTSASNQYGVYDIFGTAFAAQTGAFQRVLKVKYNSPKATGTTPAIVGTDYTTNEVFNRLKIFVVAKGSDGYYYPVTYVSAGSPIKTVEDYERYTALDMSQSRAAASNVSISNYRYDNGKGWFSPVNQWALSTNILGTGTQTSNTVVPLNYSFLSRPDGLNGVSAQKLFGAGSSYKWYNDSQAAREDSIPLDNFGRIVPQYHMIRNSVMAASNSGSSIISNQPDVFLCQPCPEWDTAAQITETPVTDFSTKMKNNGSSNSMILASLNTTAQKSITDETVTSNPKEYLLLTFDSQTNKVFFNATNYANGLMSDASFSDTSGIKIAGVEYLHIDGSGTKTQNAYWKPLKFKDTTKIDIESRDTTNDKYNFLHTSLAKSGYISYDMPSDWTPTSIKNLCGGVYNTASGNYAACTAAGNDDVAFTATAVTNNAASNNGYGDSVTLTIGSSAQTAIGAIGSADDVGRFKYAAIVSGAAQASGAMFWVGSGASNGWNGTDKITLMVGTTGTAASNGNYKIPINGDVSDLRFSLRRINIYDVVVGASKSYSDDGTIGDYRVAELIAVGGNNYNVAAPSYFKNTYNCADSDLTGSSWATNSKYVLKLTLSGTTGDGTSGTPCPTVWNVFDGNQGDSVILKQDDDSAYNLNSIAITSDISIGRQGQFFKAITRKGQVYVVKTGIAISEVGFTSVALGDEDSSTAFDDHGPSTLYGHLHTMRNIQSEGVGVYWDEPQKDGTYVRFWGKVTNLNETRGVGGPRAIMNYTFTLVIEKIALLQDNGFLMTDIYPLGGIKNERDYS